MDELSELAFYLSRGTLAGRVADDAGHYRPKDGEK